ncbi:hypothetical protein BWQ96_04164 [Gracilariopsis chorda]|uniref:Uncharacterized protein n=1 Tax=Gracilariopsis chorda TaxID=448386 RepID=A0A2V3IVB1_9FLOR|nr:hypothetical protein BWQ96_04164 [Gracilariopsis chorda]|eukprot:PXF46064.1 hypothetical protein BWQ96_04164 [Gracilariopsis chorda]
MAGGLFDAAKLRIQQLNADNYFMQSHKVQLVLRAKDVWRLVTGTEVKPETDAAMLKFETRRDTAFSCILLSVHESCVAPVMNMRDSSAISAKVKSEFEIVSQASIDALLESYQYMRMDASERVLDYINRLAVIEMSVVA